MVCMGNICRSPLAEGILKNLIAREQLAGCTVDSAGTSPYHVGELPHPRSIAIADAHGIDIRDQRARLVVLADFDKFDRIYVMDSENYQGLQLLTERDEQKMAKVAFITNLVYPAQNRAVPDPYSGGADGYKLVYDMLQTACEKLVAELKTLKIA
jgi:protein-tyrosine phosphatase